MNFEILSKTKVVGLQEDSLTSFQNFMLENIAWDSQVRADYYQSNKNTVLLELPVRLRRDIQIENINGALDAQVNFELIYKQDQGKLVSSLVVDTQYLLCIDDQDIDFGQSTANSVSYKKLTAITLRSLCVIAMIVSMRGCARLSLTSIV